MVLCRSVVSLKRDIVDTLKEKKWLMKPETKRNKGKQIGQKAVSAQKLPAW